MIRQLTVDFNDDLGDDLIAASDRDAVPGVRIAVGERLVVGDDDWGVAEAEVVAHDPVTGAVTVRVLGDLIDETLAAPRSA